MSDLSVTHNIRHIDEKRYSFCFHFIVYLKYNFWKQLCKTSQVHSDPFCAFRVIFLSKLTSREESVPQGVMMWNMDYDI